MPNFELKEQPVKPIVVVDTDKPFAENDVKVLFMHDEKITLCVRSKTGHEKRGGYFFCIEKCSQNTFRLFTMESELVADALPLSVLIKLINHVSGLAFDEEMLLYCQNEINFRKD